MDDAARSGSVKGMKVLIANGAKVDEVDKNGRTPLHEASSYGQVDATTWLIANGAKVDTVDKNGRTPLHEASSYGTPQSMKPLIEGGAKVNAVDNNGRTPLHEAGSRGSADAMVLLIENGGRLSAKDKNGKTPVDLLKEKLANDPAALEKAMEKIRTAVKKTIDLSMNDADRGAAFENLVALGEKSGGTTTVAYSQAALPPSQATPSLGPISSSRTAGT